jgi:hypothetical protein
LRDRIPAGESRQRFDVLAQSRHRMLLALGTRRRNGVVDARARSDARIGPRIAITGLSSIAHACPPSAAQCAAGTLNAYVAASIRRA